MDEKSQIVKHVLKIPGEKLEITIVKSEVTNEKPEIIIGEKPNISANKSQIGRKKLVVEKETPGGKEVKRKSKIDKQDIKKEEPELFERNLYTDIVEPEILGVNQNAVVGCFECYICKQILQTESELKSHFEIHSQDNGVQMENEQNIYDVNLSLSQSDEQRGEQKSGSCVNGDACILRIGQIIVDASGRSEVFTCIVCGRSFRDMKTEMDWGVSVEENKMYLEKRKRAIKLLSLAKARLNLKMLLEKQHAKKYGLKFGQRKRKNKVKQGQQKLKNDVKDGQSEKEKCQEADTRS